MQTHPIVPVVAHNHCEHQQGTLAAPFEIDDEAIVGMLCDLFARRTNTAFGECLDWWLETLQCDLHQNDAAGVALVVLSKWPFDLRVGAPGVATLRANLLTRARMLLARGARDDAL